MRLLVTCLGEFHLLSSSFEELKVVTVRAEAGAVGARSVSRAPVVAGLDVAKASMPTLVASTVTGFAGAVRTAVHVASF